MNTIFLDTETTGTGDNDRLVQVAFKAPYCNISSDQLYKSPLPITIEAMSVCHITNEMIENKQPFIGSSEFKFLQTELAKADTVFVAHNASFDLKILAREGIDIPNKHICTMKVAYFHDKEDVLPQKKLQFLRYQFGLKFDQVINPHDALSDVLVLEKLFEYYSQFYSIEEMIEISSKPILLKKFAFGKYKGQWFKDVAEKDIFYIEWVKNNVAMDENLKHTIDYYYNLKPR